MTDTEQPRTNLLRDAPPAVWIAIAAILMAIAIALHGIMPRYEFSADGENVGTYDRWTGRFQRATYSAQGVPTLTPVVRPF